MVKMQLLKKANMGINQDTKDSFATVVFHSGHSPRGGVNGE